MTHQLALAATGVYVFAPLKAQTLLITESISGINDMVDHISTEVEKAFQNISNLSDITLKTLGSNIFET